VEPQDSETATQLDEVRQKVQQTQAARQSQIGTLTKNIDEAFTAGRLCPPQPNNALDLLRELSQIDPRSRYVRGARLKLKDRLSERAARLTTQEDWNGAKAALAAALQITPNDADLSERLVQVNKKLDQIAQAEQEKLRRQEQERQRIARGLESRRNGLAAYRNGNYERAIEELRQAGDIQGFDEEICYFIGASYLELRQPERALTSFHDALAANPNNPSAHAQLGLLYLNQRKDFARAEEHFLRAQALGGAAGFDKNRLAQLIRETRYQALLAKASATPIAVEHRHTFGSCQGTLLFTGTRVEYRTKEGDHGFIRQPGNLKNVTFKDDGLEMRFDDKKYNFRFKNREDLQLVRELLKKP
jgi:tetratricopeptide (TPR) repeat protein